MRISIDEEVITKKNFTLSELLICLAIKYYRQKDILDQIEDLKNTNKIYKSQANHHYLRPQTERIIDDILNVSDNAPEINELDKLVIKLQELFPKERKPDSNGVPRYSYRGNKRDVTMRLQKFFKLYGQYSYNDVYECTKRYVESFKYDKTYMRILPYYIMKDGESTLANELENMSDEEPVIENPNEDWTNTLL